ncbi:hypothetical protein CC79DRAFT_1074840 [Sarocladium strictum]
MTSRSPSEAAGSGPPVRKEPRRRSPPPTKRTKACERCWKRKEKCDRKLPICTNCQRNGFECLGRVPPPRESFEDVTLTHGTFQSYLESLEKNQISQATVSVPGDHGPSETAPPASPSPQDNAPESDPQGPLPTGHQPECPSDEEDPSVGDTMGAIGQLTNRAMAESRAEPDQSIDKLTLLHMVQAALTIDGHDPTASVSRRSAHGDPDRLTSCALPPREEALQYIRNYLGAVCQIPYLVRTDETTLIFQLDEVADSAPEQHVSQPNVDADTSANERSARLFEIQLQVAIGMMVSQDAVRLANYSHSLHAAATCSLPAVFKSKHYADSLRSLLLLIAFSLVHPGGGSMWHLLGLAIRLCITAGFHKEPTSQTGLPSNDIEEARWLFWSVYVLDRCVSVVMDRPFGIQDVDISVQLPTEKPEEPQSRAPSYEAAKAREALGLHYIRHAQIISSIRSNSRANPISHYGNLLNWRDFDLPASLSSSVVRSWEDNANQLECRGLLQIVNLLEESQRAISQARANFAPSKMIQEIYRDARAACRRFIMTSYDQGGQSQTIRSFLDSYDLIAATVGFICLEAKQGQASSAAPGVHSPDKAELMEVVHKASVLVTQMASRFPALDGFHRFFLGLSLKAVGESPGEIQGCPQVLPLSLRQLINATFPTVAIS